VAILNEMEEVSLYSQVMDKSEKLRLEAFNTSVVSAGTTPRKFSTFPVAGFQCPSWSGDPNMADRDGLLSTQWSTTGGSEEFFAKPTNYYCTAGTHFKTATELVENGILVSADKRRGGMRQGAIKDGISKTILVCESKEENYNCWYDGQVTWVTGLITDKQADLEAGGSSGDNDGDGVSDDLNDPTAGWTTALNVGPQTAAEEAAGTNFYCAISPPYQSGASGRAWGPSSDHSGGVVMHVFADDHIEAISEQIEAKVYYAMVTANGGENVERE
jgi:hypothetical protein